MGNTTSKNKSIVIVGKEAKIKTIGEALQKVPIRGIILVLPGVYSEDLITIDKPVAIFGIANQNVLSNVKALNNEQLLQSATEISLYAKESILQNNFAVKIVTTIELPRRYQFIENVFISNIEFVETTVRIAADCTFSYCAFTHQQSNVVIEGDCCPSFHTVLFQSAGTTAVSLNSKARCEMNNCTFCDCTTGLLSVDSSTPQLFECIFSRCGTAAHVTNNGGGMFSSCTFSHNIKPALLISNGGNPTLRRCHFTKNASIGVFVTSGGRGVITDCTIDANLFPGMAVCGEEGGPIVAGTTIANGKNAGILWYEKGTGIVSHCTVKGMQMTGLESREGGFPVVSHCSILDDEANGIFVHNDGRGVFSDCQVMESFLPTVAVCASGDPVFNRCTISSGKDNALLVYENGKGFYNQCEFIGHVTKPIDIRDECKPTLKDCINKDGKLESVLKWIAQIPEDENGGYSCGWIKEESVDYDEKPVDKHKEKKKTKKRKSETKERKSAITATVVASEAIAERKTESSDARGEERKAALDSDEAPEDVPSTPNPAETATAELVLSAAEQHNFYDISKGGKYGEQEQQQQTQQQKQRFSVRKSKRASKKSKHEDAGEAPLNLLPSVSPLPESAHNGTPAHTAAERDSVGRETSSTREDEDSNAETHTVKRADFSPSGVQVSGLERFLSKNAGRVFNDKSFYAVVPTQCSSSPSISFTESSSIAPQLAEFLEENKNRVFIDSSLLRKLLEGMPVDSPDESEAAKLKNNDETIADSTSEVEGFICSTQPVGASKYSTVGPKGNEENDEENHGNSSSNIDEQTND